MWENTYAKYAPAGKLGLFRTMHQNIAFLETYGLLEAFLYKHLLVA